MSPRMLITSKMFLPSSRSLAKDLFLQNYKIYIFDDDWEETKMNIWKCILIGILLFFVFPCSWIVALTLSTWPCFMGKWLSTVGHNHLIPWSGVTEGQNKRAKGDNKHKVTIKENTALTSLLPFCRRLSARCLYDSQINAGKPDFDCSVRTSLLPGCDLRPRIQSW